MQAGGALSLAEDGTDIAGETIRKAALLGQSWFP
jgi:hypothetical protein